MKKLVLLLISAFMVSAAMAQVTTSSIAGKVVDANGNPVIGAAVVAVHVPSGTQYGTTVDVKGNYRIVNVRPGSPYTIEVQMLGYTGVINTDIVIALGDAYILDVVMSEQSLAIDDIVISAQRNTIMNSARTGASTNVSTKEMEALPTISRSLSDFTRLTPQAGGSNSFGGRDGRYNNIMIDGASFNNRFGLSNNNMPGGDAQPVSLDAIQEVTVNVSPFDIRESSFTGASINAITRSGSNIYEGSAYTYLRPKSFTGEKIGDQIVPNAKETNMQTYGFRFGGPIIKNKLFFFVNGEYENESKPGISWKPSTNGVGVAKEYISRTTESDLERVKQHLISKYDYDPGSYKNFKNFTSRNTKLMGRIDWNISDQHKFTVRYNQVISKNDQTVNNNSVWSGLSRSSNRYSVDAFTFSNANYGFENSVYSLTAELNSQFSSVVSNKLLVAWTSVRDQRTSNSDKFPFVDIWEGGTQYMSFGYELFSYNNDVQNKSLIITDNLTFALGDHTLVAGLSFEKQYVKNAYMRSPLSYYRYASVDDFINDRKPIGFSITYPYGEGDAPGVELNFGMASIYVQDEWRVNPKFKLTAGLRMEVPLYFNDISIAAATAIQGVGPNGSNLLVKNIEFDGGQKVNMGRWPKSRPLFSPRIGFNWDVTGDRKVQIRGGSGLFTGLLPFVWFTNQPNGAGILQSPEVGLKAADIPNDMTFNPNYKEQLAKYIDLFPAEQGVIAKGADLAKVDEDFRLPQVWRTNLAVDVALPYDLIFTLEGIYSKDINAVMQKNINIPTIPTNIEGAETSDKYDFFAGEDNRPYWTSGNNRVSGNVNAMMLLTNTSKGYQASITAQLTKKYSNNWSGMIAYTYNIAKDVSANPGSTAASAWSSNQAVNSLNDPGLSYSNFSVPHRINGYVTYSVNWLRHLTSTFSLYYNGSHAGRLSYVYSNDMNGDGFASDLMYIPRDASEIKFKDIVDGSGNVTYTATQQSEDFFNFVDGNKYLRKNKGKYAERYGDVQRWVNRIDFKFLQDVYSNFGREKRYSLQVSLDILNLGNLINKNWVSCSYPIYGVQSYQNMRLLTYQGRDAGGHPEFKVYHDTKKPETAREYFLDNTKQTNNLDTSGTWGMQLGIRLIF